MLIRGQATKETKGGHRKVYLLFKRLGRLISWSARDQAAARPDSTAGSQPFFPGRGRRREGSAEGVSPEDRRAKQGGSHRCPLASLRRFLERAARRQWPFARVRFLYDTTNPAEHELGWAGAGRPWTQRVLHLLIFFSTLQLQLLVSNFKIL